MRGRALECQLWLHEISFGYTRPTLAASGLVSFVHPGTTGDGFVEYCWKGGHGRLLAAGIHRCHM